MRGLFQLAVGLTELVIGILLCWAALISVIRGIVFLCQFFF